MLHRRPPRPRRRLARSARPLRVMAAVLAPRPGPEAPLTRTLYHLRTAEGAVCAGRVRQGKCLLLFTSPAGAMAFAAETGVETRPPLIFSRSRAEFLAQAGRCFGQGFIGGLIDPRTGPGKTEFLGFDVEQRSRGSRSL